MATVRSLELLAGRALVDNSFRGRLRKSPRTAAREINVRLTDSDIEIISSTNWDALDKLAAEVQKGLPKFTAAWAGLKASDLSRPAASFVPKPPSGGGGRSSATRGSAATTKPAGASRSGAAKSSGASKTTGAAKSKGATARKSSGKGKS